MGYNTKQSSNIYKKKLIGVSAFLKIILHEQLQNKCLKFFVQVLWSLVMANAFQPSWVKNLISNIQSIQQKICFEYFCLCNNMRLRNNKVTKLLRYVGAIMLYPVFAFWAVLTLSVMGKFTYSCFYSNQI